MWTSLISLVKVTSTITMAAQAVEQIQFIVKVGNIVYVAEKSLDLRDDVARMEGVGCHEKSFRFVAE